MNTILLEDKRSELLNRSKNADSYVDQSKGKNRYQRRVKSKVMKSVKEFNSIDMNKFFKEDKLIVDVGVKGETSHYIVTMLFSGVLEEIRDQLTDNPDLELNLKVIITSMVRAFNKENVYIHCSCPDFKYRMNYWATVNDINSGQPENRPSNITNPNDSKGPGCKHSLLVLSNNSWLNKVAAVIFNYSNYIKEHRENMYAKIIYPALYGREYTDDVQLGIEDISDEEPMLGTEKSDIDIANIEASKRGQFKAGNEYRFQKGPQKPLAGQKEFDFDSLVDEE